MQTETRTLKCQLTEDEKTERAQQAAQLGEDLSVAEAEVDRLKGQVKTANARCTSIEATIRTKLDTYKRGWETRQVECFWRPDRERQIKELIRTDTKEIVETEELPRQQTINGETESVHVDKSEEIRESDITDVMTQEAMRMTDIVREMGVEPDARHRIKRVLMRLIDESKVVKEGKGAATTYRLAATPF